MRFVTCRYEGMTTWGAVTENGAGVVDLGRRLPDLPNLSVALKFGQLADAKKVASQVDADFALADAEYERTVPFPGRFSALG